MTDKYENFKKWFTTNKFKAKKDHNWYDPTILFREFEDEYETKRNQTNNYIKGEYNLCLNHPDECWNCIYSICCSKLQHIFFQVLSETDTVNDLLNSQKKENKQLENEILLFKSKLEYIKELKSSKKIWNKIYSDIKF